MGETLSIAELMSVSVLSFAPAARGSRRP